MFGPLKLWF